MACLRQLNELKAWQRRGLPRALQRRLRCGARRVALCCRQPRLPIGAASFLEIPAGMLDGSGSFAGVAAKEMAEETGVEEEVEEIEITRMFIYIILYYQLNLKIYLLYYLI